MSATQWGVLHFWCKFRSLDILDNLLIPFLELGKLRITVYAAPIRPASLGPFSTLGMWTVALFRLVGTLCTSALLWYLDVRGATTHRELCCSGL